MRGEAVLVGAQDEGQAMLFSLLIPGGGQLYVGDLWAAVRVWVWYFFAGLPLVLLYTASTFEGEDRSLALLIYWPVFAVIHVLSVADARIVARQRKAPARRLDSYAEGEPAEAAGGPFVWTPRMTMWAAGLGVWLAVTLLVVVVVLRVKGII
jgi:hypothetical protein